MVAPVSSTPNAASGINSLLQTQNTGRASNAAANRNTSLASTQKASQLNARTPVDLKNITLSSNGTPPANLPRGSIVDKLV